MPRLAVLLVAGALAAASPVPGQALQDPDSTAAAPDSVAAPADSLLQSGDPQSADTVVQSVDTAAAIEGNPFAGFETHMLSNGVKLWYRRLPGAPNVSVSVGIPFGWDHDPEGHEQLAHFTEHMLFSDHRGMTEQEIKEQIEGRGGRRNGVTTPDHTWYYVTIGREHGLFALEWLGRLMEPHAMDPEVVERNREPVANEIGARPREFAERVLALLDVEWLRPPGFWEREFGLETRAGRSYDRWATLQSITAEDLQEFYERYYAPSSMTVTVVGDLEREEVLEQAQRTFGSLLPRSTEIEPRRLEDPERRRVTHAWGFRPNVVYDRRFKLFEPTAPELLHAQFLSDYLGRRLNQRLRYGERKAVYGISVELLLRGPAAFMGIRGTIDEEDYDFAREVIAEELEFVRTGGHPADEFEADRTALVQRLEGETKTAEALNQWTHRLFYQPRVFRDFPDLAGFYSEVSQADLAAFAEEHLVPEREVVSVTHVQPIDVAVLILAGLALLGLTFRLTGWVLKKPIDMKQIRYMARFRVPVVLGAIRFLLFAAVAVVVARLLVFGFTWIGMRWVAPLDVYGYQMAAYAAMGVTGFVLLVVYLSRMPRKLLLFPDHLRIKARSFRSRVLVPEEIAEIAKRRGPGVYFGKGLLRTSVLTFGFLKPGIHLKPHEGRALFFRTRNTEEMLAMLQQWWGGKGEQPAEASDAPDPDPPPDAPPDDPPPDDDLDIDSLEIDDPELEALLRSNP